MYDRTMYMIDDLIVIPGTKKDLIDLPNSGIMQPERVFLMPPPFKRFWFWDDFIRVLLSPDERAMLTMKFQMNADNLTKEYDIAFDPTQTIFSGFSKPLKNEPFHITEHYHV